jgi:hypothetical protein
VNIRNNIPIDPGSKFSTATGKIYCHSLLENNSDKSTTIYHYCYLNVETNAKVRTRVGNGNDIHAISHRDLETANKLTWKVPITHDNKKILDTHNFELA